ncbi:MAG TPA: hypothetical protein VGW80_09995 [Solirubrobacterales bacterium]|nr:hypothetical protein [Solirubrobacterales bacterium]
MALGCGSGDDEAQALSKAEYFKQGNAICHKWQEGREEALGVATKRFEGQNSAKAKEEALLLVLKPYQQATKKLRELPPPENQAKRAEALVKEMEQSYLRAKADPLSALESVAFFQKANEMAEKFGLKECIV